MPPATPDVVSAPVDAARAAEQELMTPAVQLCSLATRIGRRHFRIYPDIAPMNFVIRLVVNAAALWLAARFITGISYTGGWQGLVAVAIVFGVINAFVRPVLSFLSMPIQFITLGLFTLVLNAFMLMLTSRIATSLACRSWCRVLCRRYLAQSWCPS